MEKIKKTLEKLFSKHRLIFWYDDGSLQPLFEELDISQEKLLLDGNEFGVKYKLLKEHPSEQFLIYSPHPKPKDEENLLLDLILSNHLFDADKASIVVNELGLDLALKSVIKRYEAFFNAKKRVEKLKKITIKSEKDLLYGMISTILHTKNSIEDFLFALLAEYARGESKKLQELKKFGLDVYLFDELKNIFGFAGESFDAFVIELILSHFYFSVDQEKMPLNKEAVIFVSKWMDSVKNKGSFEILSKIVAKRIEIEKLLETIPIQKLQDVDTFEEIDKKIIIHLKNTLLKNGTFDKEIIEKRKNLFWYENFANIYNALDYALRFYRFIESLQIGFRSLDEGFDSYIKHYYKGDLYYRKFLFYSKKESRSLHDLYHAIEDRYEIFQRDINDSWQNLLDKEDCISINRYEAQKDFFQTYVQPNLDKKVFVIISDALRYEAGYELFQRLLEQNRFEVQIEPMVASVPTYTQLGIASLLPYRSLAFKNGDTILVDGQNSSGSANRDKILKNSIEKSVYLNSEEFLKFKRGDAFIKEHRLFYIYHNDIDAISDHALSEENCVFSVERAFEKLQKIIKHVFNLNGNFVILTADHGFLYQDRVLDEGEFCSWEKIGTIEKTNRRFIIGKNLYENRCTKKYAARKLGIDSDEEVLIARSINRIRVQGGGNRFVHGGAALQELAIPVIVCKKIRKDDVRSVEVDILKSFSKITSNQIVISFFQREPIEEKIKPRTLKIAFYAKDGELLSNIHKITFDKRERDSRDLEYRVQFLFNQKALEYQGQEIYLKMIETIEGTNIEKTYKEEPFTLYISFMNDFDEL